MADKELHPHAEFIHELGGSTSLARELNIEVRRVDNWRRRGISWKWRPRVHLVAKERFVQPPPGFLDASADEAA